MKRYPLVKVEWEDACSVGGWDTPCDIRVEPSRCITKGLLVKRDKRGLVISHTQDERGHVADKFTIPKGCIKSIERIKE